MKAKTLLFDNDKIKSIDGNEVIFVYKLNFADFPHLTLRVAREINMPFEIAVCRCEDTISGVLLYGKFLQEWRITNQFNDFIIQHLIRRQLEKDFQYSY